MQRHSLDQGLGDRLQDTSLSLTYSRGAFADLCRSRKNNTKMLSSRSKSCPFKATPAPLVSLSLLKSLEENRGRCGVSPAFSTRAPEPSARSLDHPTPAGTGFSQGLQTRLCRGQPLGFSGLVPESSPFPSLSHQLVEMHRSSCGVTSILQPVLRAPSAPKPQVGSRGCGSPVYAPRLARTLPQWCVGSPRQHPGRCAFLCPTLGARASSQAPHSQSPLAIRLGVTA